MTSAASLSHSSSQHLEQYYTSIICPDLILKNPYKNISQLPVFDKIVLHTTSKNYAVDRKNLLPALLALELITGQKACPTSAKKSVASFKIRDKQILGCKVTVRRKHLSTLVSFLNTLVLPRIREFSGYQKTSLDPRGNLSFGFRDLLLFPPLENHFELFQTLRGIDINFSIKGLTKTSPQVFYSAYNLPQSK